MLMLLWSALAIASENMHPLEPLDLSSPRATLENFLNKTDAFYKVLEKRGRYWPSGPP